MTEQRRTGRTLLLLIAILGWLGLALQLVVSAHVAASAGRSPFAGILDALCYFTVLTNLLVAIVATVALTGARGFFASRGVLRFCEACSAAAQAFTLLNPVQASWVVMPCGTSSASCVLGEDDSAAAGESVCGIPCCCCGIGCSACGGIVTHRAGNPYGHP
jgi:hypothetical protein